MAPATRLYCENEKGEKFIIELQNVKQLYFKDRSLFYATFPLQSQAPKGKDWDYYLKAVYTIGVLNFGFPDENNQERFMREIKLMDKETHEVFYDKLTFIYLEMPRFRKAESELETHFDKWLYVLKNLNRLQEKPVKFQERIFEKLFNEAEIAKLNPEEMDAYEKSLKSYRDQYSVLETARKEGASEREIEIARSMKQYGDPLEKIAAITGLSKEEIEKL